MCVFTKKVWTFDPHPPIVNVAKFCLFFGFTKLQPLVSKMNEEGVDHQKGVKSSSEEVILMLCHRQLGSLLLFQSFEMAAN